MTLNGQYANDRALEWLLASLMVLWGVGLAMPWKTFADPHYAYLQAIADEGVWAAFSMGIGAIRCLALYVNGQWRKTPIIRNVCAGVGVIWWITLGFLIYQSADRAPPQAAVFWYPAFILAEFYSLHRSALDMVSMGSFRKRKP